MNVHTYCIFHTFPSLALCLTHIHTYTYRQAAMGGGNARNAPNPGLVFWLVPDFMPSPPGSVARPPCARPTGSNTRPGQPSSSSRPIINQQAALESTSPPPPHASTAGAPRKLGRKNTCPLSASHTWRCSGKSAEKGSTDGAYVCLNSVTCQHFQSFAFKCKLPGCNLACNV